MSDNKQENLNSQELPFFARYLEGQFCEDLSEEEMQSVQGGLRPSHPMTKKFPSDQDEHAYTKKYPSDGDDHIYVTQKYPSDGDDHILLDKA